MCQPAIYNRFIPFQQSTLEQATFGSRSELDMWAVPSCHRLTSRQVAVMTTCRDLSKLALRHAPAECLPTHSVCISRQQMDFWNTNESIGMTQSINHLWNLLTLEKEVFFDESSNRAEPKATYWSQMCSRSTHFAYLIRWMHGMQQMYYNQAARGL